MKKILIAGGNGMVGSAIKRKLDSLGFKSFALSRKNGFDFTHFPSAIRAINKFKPDVVFIAAAKVGGIHANNTYPVDFLRENLLIELNLLEACHIHNVSKVIFLGSSCIYPKNIDRPIKETDLLNGHLEQTNSAYALAKISGIELCKSYRKQYNRDYISCMPCNVYGINDNYHPENSHVIPALIRKFHLAKENNEDFVILWGDGSPLREFIYADDLADACVFLMDNYSDSETINIGTDDELSIKNLALLIKNVVGYDGKICFDSSMPNGTMRKKLNTDKINNLGWKSQTPIITGLQKTYENFINVNNFAV